MLSKLPVFCLMGPTATGKTDLALQLIKLHPQLEIISVDSALVYKGMDIGTAKPPQAILDSVPHHLINIRDPAVPYSAADFCHDAKAAIEEIQSKEKIPLLVGGTMLYFRALQQGLADLPVADAATRDYFTTLARTEGTQALYEELKKVDPVSAARIHPNDPQRLQRALEVYSLTGRPMSELQNNQSIVDNTEMSFLNVILMPEDRECLHRDIALRVDKMLAAGLIDEVKQLYKRGDVDLNKPALRAVGYQQSWRYLAGEYDEKTLRDKIIVATRQLAKRQITWLRTWPNPHYFLVPQIDLLGQVNEFLQQNLPKT
jgi:tRNA dimethylallyltransferase